MSLFFLLLFCQLKAFGKQNKLPKLPFFARFLECVLIVYVLIFWRSFDLQTAVILLLLAICLSDLRWQLIPNRFQLIGCVLAGLVCWQRGFELSKLFGFLWLTICFFVCALGCEKIFRRGIGGGDLKLILWLGLIVGERASLFLLLSLVYSLPFLFVRNNFPFAPAITLAYLSL